MQSLTLTAETVEALGERVAETARLYGYRVRRPDFTHNEDAPAVPEEKAAEDTTAASKRTRGRPKKDETTVCTEHAVALKPGERRPEPGEACDRHADVAAQAAAPATPPPPAAAPTAPPAPGTAPRPEGKRGEAYDSLRAVKNSPAHGVVICRKILDGFGATTLADLKDEQLDYFVAACKKALAPSSDDIGI